METKTSHIDVWSSSKSGPSRVIQTVVIIKQAEYDLSSYFRNQITKYLKNAVSYRCGLWNGKIL